MVHIIRPPSWKIPDREATPESIYFNRREVLRAMGIGAGALAGSALLPRTGAPRSVDDLKKELDGLPALAAKKNAAFKVDEPLTPFDVAARYNNFYEFSADKDVWEEIGKFTPRPWTLEVGGMVDKPRTYDVDALIKRMPLQERVYRLRCVEAWSMIVPWIGFPMNALLKEAGPKSGAKFVRMTTFMRPEEATRQGKTPWFGAPEPWPYTEGLTLPEAMNDLTLVTVGLYGKILPKQHGAPLRIAIPWKYGFKSIKSVVKIELTDTQPATFWNTIAPHEYGFESNVNPAVSHPRWTQMLEQDIGTKRRKPTLYMNGYEEQVAGLYKPL